MLIFFHILVLQIRFSDYLEVAAAVVMPRGVDKLLLVHRYSVDIFSHSRPSGILGWYGKQNTVVLGGVRFVALSISSHKQTQ